MNTIDLVRLFKHKRGSPAQRLWAMVLLLAVKDGAARVWYDPAKGDSRLGYEIGGVEYDLVPPPELIQTQLLKFVEKLLRRRSAWSLIARLFGGRSPPLEGSFVAKFEGQRVTVSATLDLALSRVVLRLSPETRIAPAARAALERVLGNILPEDLRELPDEELQ